MAELGDVSGKMYNESGEAEAVVLESFSNLCRRGVSGKV